MAARHVDLPEEALKQLHAATQRLIMVGDVWWLPQQYVRFFPSSKDRFCLVAGKETTTGGTPAVIHLIAGSTKPATSPTTHVPGQEAGLNHDTYFKFQWSGTVSSSVLFVQLTPPGSACSIALGKGLVDMPPGSVKGMQLVVADIHAARAELLGRGVEVSEVQEFPWGKFVFFNDPDGNAWAVQQGIPAR